MLGVSIWRSMSSPMGGLRKGAMRFGAHGWARPTCPKPSSISLGTAPPLEASPAMRRPQRAEPLLSTWPPTSVVLRESAQRLKVAMSAPRHLMVLGYPITTNLSNIAGHGSFLALAAGYMESDVLLLRGYAVGGVILSILFQYYRAQPLWLPISWNGVFLLINLVMIALLLDERRGAADLDAEQRAIFEGVFSRLGLSSVDFLKLVRLADRRLVRANGPPLAVEGREQEEMFLLVAGAAEVMQEGERVADLKPLQFVGSMSFLRFLHAGDEEPEQQVPAEEAQRDARGRARFIAEAAAAAVRGETAPGRSSSGGDAVQAASAAKVEVAGTEAAGVGEGEAGAVGGNSGDRLDSTAAGRLRERQLQELEKYTTGRSQSLGHGCERLSTTTVRCKQDSTVLAWDFHLLRAYLRRHPDVAAAFQTSVSADLTRKVDQSRHSGERYRVLLRNVLAYGEVTHLEKKKLQRFRSLHGISAPEHLKLLEEAGWTPQEFETGIRDRAISPKFAAYDRMVAETLHGRDEVSPAARAALRRQRAVAGVEPEEHILALSHHGWSPDEYEEGCKQRRAIVAAKKTRVLTTHRTVSKAIVQQRHHQQQQQQQQQQQSTSGMTQPASER